MAKEIGMMGDWYWHVHHVVLCEVLTEPLSERIKYVKEMKPPEEVPIRLKWMTPVRGLLPRRLDEAGTAFLKARDDYLLFGGQFGWILDEAGNALWLERKNAEAVLELLHAQEHPGCPWNGKTLFPGKVGLI